MSRRTSTVLLAILLLSINLRPTAASVGPVLTDVRHGLGMGPTSASLLTSLPVLAFALFGPLAPGLARRFGPHRVTLASLLALAVGLLLRAIVHGEVVFLFFTVFALAGMAMANVLLPSLINLHFPDNVGRVTAFYSTMLSVGLTLSLILTVPISQASGGWRMGLGVWAVAAVVAALPWIPMTTHDRALEPTPRTVGFGQVLVTRIGLTMVVFFGLQALQAYVVYGWFATLWRDAGFSAGVAGLLVGLVAATSIPLSLWAPARLARGRRPGSVVAGLMTCYVLGYLALLVSPRGLAVPAAILVGAGTVVFPLVLVLINLRARTPAGVAALSSLTQSAGYLIAGTGPFTIGLLHGTPAAGPPRCGCWSRSACPRPSSASPPPARPTSRTSSDGHGQTTESGRSFWPVGPIWVSVPISGQTPQS